MTQLKHDPIEKWLISVAYSGSGSKATEVNYRRCIDLYLKFIGRTAEEILAEYKGIQDFNELRKFRDKIADEIKEWIISLRERGLADSTIRSMVGVPQSFYKHNRIDIGFIPTAQGHFEYHNRDIRREEISAIMSISLPKDRAFYAVMAQSGLRPVTLCRLQIKHIEYQRLLMEESPVKIDVPREIAKGRYHSYFSFIGLEAIQNLKSYLKTRNVTRDSYLFVRSGSKNTPLKTAAFSSQFNKTARKLKKTGVLEFEVREGKPSELRLYSLRKFFEKYAHNAGEEFSEFWMGHKVGVQDHYRAMDPEHHRKQYAELAAPHLSIETKTSSETVGQIRDLREELDEAQKKLMDRDKEINEVKTQLNEMQKKLDPFLDLMKSVEKEDLHAYGMEMTGAKTRTKGVFLFTKREPDVVKALFKAKKKLDQKKGIKKKRKALKFELERVE